MDRRIGGWIGRIVTATSLVAVVLVTMATTGAAEGMPGPPAPGSTSAFGRSASDVAVPRLAVGGTTSRQPRGSRPKGIPSGHNSQLNGISCISAVRCTAVGVSYVVGMGNIRTLVESSNGSAWAIIPSPNPISGDDVLKGVSCVGTTFCMAVGWSVANFTGLQQTLIESWNGTAWSAVPSPGSSSSGIALDAVSCTSSSDCVAVGSVSNVGTLVEAWNGAIWSIVASPDPAGSGASLSGITCTGPTDCIAVGSYSGQSAELQTLVESWNGTVWTIVPSADTGLPDPSNSLSAVTCVSTATCVAVGAATYYLGYSTGVSQTLVESWNGATWTVVPSRDATGDDALSGVSCVSSSDCTAVGSSSSGTLIESWNGSVWSIAPSPNAGNGASILAGVSCVGSTSCAAVGSTYGTLTGRYQTLSVSWNGASWNLASSPNIDVLVQPVVGMASTPTGDGYWLVDSAGDVTAHGAALHWGDLGGGLLNAPIVGMEPTVDGQGYWLLAADGGIFTFGDAAFYGSMGGQSLNAPMVGMTRSADGRGYWLVAADGGIFTFGDARFFGSEGGKALRAPIVGMAGDPVLGGYWLVAEDGGVFSFQAAFHGSVADHPLAAPVVGMAATSDGGGYWLVAGDGGMFALGNATFQGSMAGSPRNAAMTGMAVDSATSGYWAVGGDGGIFSFGAPFYGAN